MNSILEYEKLVYSIAKKYSFNNDIEDLYQVGMIGLHNATNNYNSSYNIKFSSYAYKYIQGEILKYIRENKLIKVSHDLIKLNNSINKTKELLTQKLLREPSIEELSSFLEIDEKIIIDAINSNEYIKSLDYELNDEGKELNLYDYLTYEESNYKDEILDLKEEINNLSSEEQELIKLRYFDDLSQQETSKNLGISQVQVSRKESKVLIKLKDKLSA